MTDRTGKAPTAAECYRVTLAHGHRDCQLWQLWRASESLTVVGKRFNVSRERARQVCARAQETLDTWPTATAWQRALPMRLRELCVLDKIATPAQLVPVILGEWRPRHWREDDVDEARRVLQLPDVDGDADGVLGKLRTVVDTLQGLAPDVDALIRAGVIGAELLRHATDALGLFGRDVHVAYKRDGVRVAIRALADATPSEDAHA